MASDSRVVTLDDILASRSLMAEKLHRTPMLSSTALGERIGIKLHFKA